jgi:hypothetical protein
VSLAGTVPPAVPPVERSPVGMTVVVATVEVPTPVAAASAGRRAPAGRSGSEGSKPTAPQAVQSHHPRSTRGRSETGCSIPKIQILEFSQTRSKFKMIFKFHFKMFVYELISANKI